LMGAFFSACGKKAPPKPPVKTPVEQSVKKPPE
jgi:hypothetical protein